jgi:hypothetical protein
MQHIPIALAAADMVVGRDIRRPDNPQGPPICGRGVTLTDSLIERLRQMGIASIVVEGHPVEMAGEKSLEVLLLELDSRFRLSAREPHGAKLKEIMRQRLIREMGRGDAEPA